MLVVDSHLDIAMNGYFRNRDYRKSIAEIRADEEPVKDQKGMACNTVSFPEMRKTEIGLSFCTTIAPTRSGRKGRPDFKTQEIAYAQAQGQLAYYREHERQGDLRMIGDRQALAAHMDEWRADPENTPLGMVLTMEGPDAIVDLESFDLWWEDGLRGVSLAHYGPSVYAHGTGCLGGVTDRGRELLKRMNDRQIVLDVTHFNDESFWQAVEIYNGPVWASHSNCRVLVDGDRQMTDDMLNVVIERDGVVGAVLDAWMLETGWVRGVTTNERVTMETVVDHIDHVCQVAGNADHAGIGTDLDGGYGTEQTPNDCDTIYALQKIPGILRSRGYDEADIEKIMHGNWLRMLDRVLPDQA